MVNYFYQSHLCNKSQIIIFINHTYIIKAERAWFREFPDCLAHTVLSSLWSWLQGGEPPPPFQTRACVSQSALQGPLSWDVLPPSTVVSRKKQPERESTMPLKQLKVNHSQQLPLLFILQYKSVGKREREGPNTATEKTLNWELSWCQRSLLDVRGPHLMMSSPSVAPWSCTWKLHLGEVLLCLGPSIGNSNWLS